MHRIGLTVLLTAALLAACAPPAAPSPAPGPFEASPALRDTTWELLTLDGAPVLPGTRISLVFTDQGVGGYAGCNWYGQADTSREDGTPALEFALTARLCLEPEGVMEQEARYVEALRAAAGHRLDGERLVVFDAAGAERLVFAREPALAMDPNDLVGTRWRLQSIDGTPSLPGSEITLAFDSATALSGHAGCRDYHGTYQARGDRFSQTYLEMAGAVCADEARLVQEGEFTTHLSETYRYRLGEGELELFTEPGHTLLFVAESD